MNKAIESLLAVAIVLSTVGGTLVAAGKVWEGLACVVVSAGLVFYRGILK
jgi:hypothetical protein